MGTFRKTISRISASSPPLRTRCVGLATLDPLLYQELATELRERRLPSVSLLPGSPVPDRVAVILTSPEEAGDLRHASVLAVAPGGDRTALWAAVEQALHPGDPNSEIVLGIDPGPRPGYAVLSGERCLAEGSLDRPESVAALTAQLRRRFPRRALRIRVGDGDRPSRDRVLNALAGSHRSVELVDEQGTTPHGRRRPRDAIAARAIARAPGRPIAGGPTSTVTITPGDIANLQRLSREHSGGKFTIPRSEADRVLRGELTLGEALVLGERRYRSTPHRPPNPSRPDRA